MGSRSKQNSHLMELKQTNESEEALSSCCLSDPLLCFARWSGPPAAFTRPRGPPLCWAGPTEGSGGSLPWREREDPADPAPHRLNLAPACSSPARALHPDSHSRLQQQVVPVCRVPCFENQPLCTPSDSPTAEEQDPLLGGEDFSSGEPVLHASKP